jgi:hypothetical protein
MTSRPTGTEASEPFRRSGNRGGAAHWLLTYRSAEDKKRKLINYVVGY